MLSLIVAATLFVGIQEQPQGEPQAEPQTEAAATRDGEADRVICRREHVVGSNRPQRICMTRREWDALRDDARDNADRLNRGAPEILEGRPGMGG